MERFQKEGETSFLQIGKRLSEPIKCHKIQSALSSCDKEQKKFCWLTAVRCEHSWLFVVVNVVLFWRLVWAIKSKM